ncbi:uncharacterized protein LOC116263692 [Nymphaea colorata]|uniref:uncharacterized protein LOC116263692 n=1 Tax=Nymphaea colorata TaxID=210225 RepID=UPI00129D474D|nr:uncharacterized protein LOC116263692 [Nymphaea colorata]
MGSASEQRGLLEALEPPHHMERLGICDYEGDKPAWYLDTNYVELRMLCLERCPTLCATVIGIKSLEELEVSECPTLCELMRMPLLKSLKVWNCDGLNTIGDLPALKPSTVCRCERLKPFANMAALKLLDVSLCPRLEQVSDDHMPALMRLKLWGLDILKQHPTHLPSLEELVVLYLPN